MARSVYSNKTSKIVFWSLICVLCYVFMGSMISVLSNSVPFKDVARFSITCFGLYTIVSSMKLIANNKKGILLLLVYFILFTTLPTISSQLDRNTFAYSMLSYSDSIMWVAVFFICYKIGYSNIDMVDNLKKIVWLIPVFFLLFIQVKNYFLINSDDVALKSTTYYPLFMFPFVTMIENKWKQYIFMFLILLTILFSVKRTGLLVFLILLCTYYYIKYISQASFVKKVGYLLFSVLLGSVLLVLFSMLVESLNIGIIDRLMNMKDDGGSGRDIVWEHTISMIEKSDILELLFGHGFNMVMYDSVLELSAHCDYLEVVYDYGIVGSFIYLLFYIKLFKYYRFIKRYHPEWRIPFILSFILVFSFSLTSHLIIYPTYFLFLCILWGLMVGHCDNKQFYIHEK